MCESLISPSIPASTGAYFDQTSKPRCWTCAGKKVEKLLTVQQVQREDRRQVSISLSTFHNNGGKKKDQYGFGTKDGEQL